MKVPRTPQKRMPRKRRANLESHYFSSPSPSPLKRQKTYPPSPDSDLNHTQLHSLPHATESRFFHSSPGSDLLLSDPTFNMFYQDFVAAMVDLYQAKPVLIQEHVANSPWRLLIAVTLLNKTAGTQSIPVFFEIMDLWPTAGDLAQAPMSRLFELLKDLGFGEKRSQRLIDISQTYLSDPPVFGRCRPSRGYTTGLFLTDEGSIQVKKVPYPPTPISHIPGCGPYALDSYRIFCTGDDEWKTVRPTDKELTKYLQWRWAITAYRKWDPHLGPGERIDLDYIRELAATFTTNPISH
ncbi:DNA glycosylase [Earliella scabrosa]|nr:DNA glycosylase [Earliella scabrosa]